MAQWYSAVLEAWWSVSRVTIGAGNFCLHHRIQIGSGAHQASYPKGTTRISSLGVNRPERESDYSPPPSAEAKNACGCTSPPQ